METQEPILVRTTSDLPSFLPVQIISEYEEEVLEIRIHHGSKPPQPELGDCVDHYNGRYLFFDPSYNAYTYYVKVDTLEEGMLDRKETIKLLRLFNAFTGMYYLLVD